MILIRVLALAFTILSCSLATSTIGLEKAKELRKLTFSESSAVITLDAESYKNYVATSPRPYDVVLFFTADNCKLCEELYNEFVIVAQFYREANANSPLKESTRNLRSVFFAKISFSQSTSHIFQKFNFANVPDLLISKPRINLISDAELKSTYLRDNLWLISMTDGVVQAQKLLQYINSRTGRDVVYKEPIYNLVISLGFLVVLGFTGYWILKTFKRFFLNRKLWFIGSLIIYCICMSGVVFNIINNVPFTGTDKNGQTEWISGGGRWQFGAEGYIMSFTIASVGLVFLSIRLFASKENQIVYSIILVLIYVIINLVEKTYKRKSHYDPHFYPPLHYIKGPLMNDQGTTV